MPKIPIHPLASAHHSRHFSASVTAVAEDSATTTPIPMHRPMKRSSINRSVKRVKL